MSSDSVLVRVNPVEDVEPDRPRHIGRIEIHKFMGASVRHVAERAKGLAIRVDRSFNRHFLQMTSHYLVEPTGFTLLGWCSLAKT